jgi:hypothetical protein
MGAVTHQLSAVDDDLHKPTNTKEANVASVALSKSSRSSDKKSCIKQHN